MYIHVYVCRCASVYCERWPGNKNRRLSIASDPDLRAPIYARGSAGRANHCSKTGNFGFFYFKLVNATVVIMAVRNRTKKTSENRAQTAFIYGLFDFHSYRSVLCFCVTHRFPVDRIQRQSSSRKFVWNRNKFKLQSCKLPVFDWEMSRYICIVVSRAVANKIFIRPWWHRVFDRFRQLH